MNRLLPIGVVAAIVAVAAATWLIRRERPDRGLQAVADHLHQSWSARFRNVTRHDTQGHTWLCGEVSRPGADGYERFIVAAGSDTPVIEQFNADAVQWGWQRYCQ